MSLFSEIARFISATVGNQRGNKPEDVRQVKSALNNLGYFDFTKQPEPHGYVTQEMDRSIKGYQKDKGLRVDKWSDYRTLFGSPHIERKPPAIDRDILLPYDPNDPVVVKKRRKYRDL